VTGSAATGPAWGDLVLDGLALEALPDLCRGRRTAIITDARVRALHGGRLPDGGVLIVEDGEACKTLDVAGRVHCGLARLGMDRGSLVLGVGGGAVCDLAGFVAATYMRGVALGLVPTTLLAQLDAAIGGKNAVDAGGAKNLVGTFHRPEFVLRDASVLSTLGAAQIRCGLAEAVKAAAVGDAALLGRIEARADALLAGDAAELALVANAAAAVKIAIVDRDERESGERRILNFGHTFGHAVELAAGLSHGEAVSVGMALAAELSVRRGLLDRTDASRLACALERLGLPLRARCDVPAAVRALGRDKKRDGDRISLVLLEGIGRARVVPVPIGGIEEVLHDLR
jgi:3-dehydroquinate synthase